ncbi:MAG: hypothetical protein ACYC2U_04020 [Candidatus Amoebophilus sp.]
MTRTILIASLLFTCSYLNIQASANPSFKRPTLRHTSGMQGIGAGVGISTISYKALVEWGYHFSSYSQIKVGVGGEWKNKDTLAYRSPFVQATFNYTFYTNYKDLFLNMLAGPLVQYTSYQNKVINLKETSFNVGLIVGGEIELFLTSNIELVASGGPTILFLKNKYGRLGYVLSIGLKFNF